MIAFLAAAHIAAFGARSCYRTMGVDVYASRDLPCPDEALVRDDIQWIYYVACDEVRAARIIFADRTPCPPNRGGCLDGGDVFVSTSSENARVSLRHELGHLVDPDAQHSDRDFWKLIEQGWK